tara:strand:+ start:215 stop:637 length:423 start_codon:yes stop_codon:yes gene_type:complete
MGTTELLFTICNSSILGAWGLLLVAPNWKFTTILSERPFIPLLLSFVYLYFMTFNEGMGSVDFSSLEGIIALYENSTPELIAAGWLHYLAFDFWVGCWVLREAKTKGIGHKWLIIPLLSTFMLGPVGILLYEATKLILKK